MNQPVPFVPSSHDESDGGDAAGAGDIESVSAGSDVADTSAPDSNTRRLGPPDWQPQ